MVTIRATYDGQLRCAVVHEPSGTTIRTDAPKDNHGLGESFSPTDLVATGLATCILTILGIVSRNEGIPLEGTTAVVEKHMVADPDRRIGALPVVVTIPARLSVEQRTRLEHAAHTCPVYLSISAKIDAPIRFVYATGD